MFVMMRRMVIKEGYADQLIEKFGSKGIIEEQEGFVDSTIMEEKPRKGEQEVCIMIRWESEAHWKQWEKSDAHIAGHKANRGKPKPDFLLHMEVKMYTVKAVKQPANS
ncbi:antibiotic biosynthesis monooxygenase family protein [Gracilibacillus xinjiangensis]|uniref:Antibiotic biosynthesis monooxygenase family protein n=1 Tax=Gracilibacillus xinjiangensis TaxID=1193282 RepID=A0ABV8X0I3_9BACI